MTKIVLYVLNNMRIKAYIFVVLALFLILMPLAAEAKDDSGQSREYQIKAAFLYNFIKFVDWPKEKMADSNEPIIIGIIGKDPFGDALDPVKDKQAKGKKLVIKRFKGFEELKKSSEKDKSKLQRKIEALRKCHLLFICSSEKENFEQIIETLEGSSVLTVEETAGFLESGGIINFIIEDKKVRFEINVAAAKRARLKIRSQLLRLAKRVVREKPSDGAEN
ncbi:MAG: YfiR family protein [Sedimentisphaerales bacterium]